MRVAIAMAVLLTLPVGAAAGAEGFDKKDAKVRLEACARTLQADSLAAIDARAELAWFVAQGEKGWEFLKDHLSHKDAQIRQAALALFCRGWPARCTERLEKLLSEKDDAKRKFAEKLHGLIAQEKRLLFAQIVDDPQLLAECAILEGKAYKYFIRMAAGCAESALEKEKDDSITVEQLKQQPHMHRGKVLSRHGVVIEVASAELPPEYGLPGWTVLPALFVSQTRELYEVRILCAPGRGEKLCAELQKGIETGKNQVMRLTGHFFKCHVKRSSKEADGPWREPLLVCPEPSFPKLGWVKNAAEELEQTGYAKYLPSVAVKVPKAEERMIVELLPGTLSVSKIRIDGCEAPVADDKFVAEQLELLKKRLPEDQAGYPSAVVLKTVGAPLAALRKAMETLQTAGIKRATFLDESELAIGLGASTSNRGK